MAEMLIPADVMKEVVSQLQVDGHQTLAARAEHVAGYLARLAAAQTEITQTADALAEDTGRLLDDPPPPVTDPDRRTDRDRARPVCRGSAAIRER